MNKGRFQLFTAAYVGGKMERQEHKGKAVEHPTAFQAEWTGRNLYGQDLCREWKVIDCSTGETVACYPTNAEFGQPDAGTLEEAMQRQRGTGINVLALFRAALNSAGHEWAECERIVAEIAPQIEEASWLETDTGRTFDLSFVLKKK